MLLQLPPPTPADRGSSAHALRRRPPSTPRSSPQLIGIGSGSTVPYVVDRIVQQGAKANAGRLFFPTGFQSKELILSAGLALGDVDMFTRLDVCIDGADE